MLTYQLPINENFEKRNLITELIEPLFNFNTDSSTDLDYLKDQIPLFDI
jgi:hypothetical protein